MNSRGYPVDLSTAGNNLKISKKRRYVSVPAVLCCTRASAISNF
jgi:hypothetical protein